MENNEKVAECLWNHWVWGGPRALFGGLRKAQSCRMETQEGLGGGGDSLLLANKETAHLISCKVSLGTDPTSTQPVSLSAYANGPLGESRVCFLDRESGHSSGIKEGSSAFCAFRLPGGR